MKYFFRLAAALLSFCLGIAGFSLINALFPGEKPALTSPCQSVNHPVEESAARDFQLTDGKYLIKLKVKIDGMEENINAGVFAKIVNDHNRIIISEWGNNEPDASDLIIGRLDQNRFFAQVDNILDLVVFNGALVDDNNLHCDFQMQLNNSPEKFVGEVDFILDTPLDAGK